jgi:hypothetical protein
MSVFQVHDNSGAPYFTNETKHLIKQMLKRNVNKPTTKALLDKLVQSSVANK